MSEFESEAERVAAIKAESDPVRKLQQYIGFMQERYGSKDDTLKAIDVSRIDSGDYHLWIQYLHLIKRCKNAAEADEQTVETIAMIEYLCKDNRGVGAPFFTDWVTNLLTSFDLYLKTSQKPQKKRSSKSLDKVSAVAYRQDEEYFLTELFG